MTRRSLLRDAGFTLLELSIVMTILGIVAAAISDNFIIAREHARRASCIMNQRNIYHGAVLYSAENWVADGDINVSVLRANGYVPQKMCECPESNTDDFDDYTITYSGLEPIDIACDVEGALHPWSP
jgi:prepilin-type N-terminal cleavage/methylation domain-containing protein